MFYNTEKSKKLQCSTELGLYRYHDCDNDLYTTDKSKGIFRYLVVALAAVIIISLVCVITYNYASESNSVILHPIQIIEDNISNEESNSSYVQLLNVSYSSDIINGPMNPNASMSDSNNDEIKDESAPHASQFRITQHEVSNNNRRQTKTELKSPRPFIYENRDPVPTGFITPTNQFYNQKYPQTQTPGRNKVKNIQEIIKYLTEHQPINESVDNTDSSRKRIKFKKQGEQVYNRNIKKNIRKGVANSFTYAVDPFFPYKPQNPSDVNLLATNSFRFAPTVQVEPKKPKKITAVQHEQSDNSNKVPNRHAANAPINGNFDTSGNGNDITVNKRKNRHSWPGPYNNYGYGYINPYNQNNVHNQLGRLPPNRLIPYQNRFRNNGLRNNRNKNKNDFMQDNEDNNPGQMVVHLNLYPKKKRQNGEIRNIESLKEKLSQHNCTDTLDESSDDVNGFTQIKNATEFNQLLQNIRFSYVDHKEKENYTSNSNNDELFQIKDTILKLDDPLNEFKYLPRNNILNSNNPSNIEVVKSIGFTVLKPNFTKLVSNNADYYTNLNNNQNQWYPMAVNNNAHFNDHLTEMSENIEQVTEQENYPRPELNIDLVIKDTTENYNEFSDETVTLPLPADIFEKYFNKKLPFENHVEWDADTLSKNPNLVNHKAHFSDASN